MIHVELKSPFPWFGGKSRAASIVWARLGNVDNYVEPFAGSLAIPLGDAGKGILAYLRGLSDRLRLVRVACGDWTRVLTPSVTFRHGMTGILLDPPYGTGEVDYSGGGNRTDIASDVRAWAIKNGDNPDLRIALCGYDGQFEMPGDWEVEEWSAAGGYSSTAEEETQGQLNRHRERVWFSPACIPVAQGSLFGAMA